MWGGGNQPAGTADSPPPGGDADSLGFGTRRLTNFFGALTIFLGGVGAPPGKHWPSSKPTRRKQLVETGLGERYEDNKGTETFKEIGRGGGHPFQRSLGPRLGGFF